MPPLLKHPIFLLSAIIYFVNKFCLAWLQLQEFMIPYLNDLLCLPVVLTLTLYLQRRIFYPRQYRTISVHQVTFTVMYITLLFELILPAYSHSFTRDYWDIVFYILGGVLYYYTINPKFIDNKSA